MDISETPLDAGEQQYRLQYAKAGAARLGLSPDLPPEEIVRALREHLDSERNNIAVQAAADEDAYADAILVLAYLFGDQICRAYGWEWMRLQFDSQAGGINVVSPNRSNYINPTSLIKDIVDMPHRANNTTLLFSMIDPEVLKLKASEADLRPGRYLGLH